MRKNGVPADISETGGSHLCNYLFYGILDYVKTRKQVGEGRESVQQEPLVGWFHLPSLPEAAALDKNIVKGKQHQHKTLRYASFFIVFVYVSVFFVCC